MPRSRHFLVMATGAMVAVAASTAGPSSPTAGATGPPRYTITDLGTLPGGSFTDAGSLNDRGDVTGVADGAGGIAPRGFLWKDGKLTDIGTLGGPQAVAGPINDAGQFTGWADLSSPAPPSIFNTEGFFCGPPAEGEPAVACRAFLADHGRKTDLGTLGGLNSAAENKGLNQWGHVAGVAETASVDPTSPSGAPSFHAFLWRNGKMLDLGTLGGGPDSVAFAVNDLDQVVGADVAANLLQASVAWWWQGGRKTALGTLGGSSTLPFAVNDRGQVVGAARLVGDAVEHAFLWQRGHMTDLGAPAGRTDSEALDINERGQVVAMSCESDGCVPYLWQNGAFTDLNTVLSASSGWQLFDATGINERGQIVGGGFHNGNFHAYLLTPVR
jgi:probable HAF family extracellular repeat protein